MFYLLYQNIEVFYQDFYLLYQNVEVFYQNFYLLYQNVEVLYQNFYLLYQNVEVFYQNFYLLYQNVEVFYLNVRLKNLGIRLIKMKKGQKYPKNGSKWHTFVQKHHNRTFFNPINSPKNACFKAFYTICAVGAPIYFI